MLERYSLLYITLHRYTVYYICVCVCMCVYIYIHIAHCTSLAWTKINLTHNMTFLSMQWPLLYILLWFKKKIGLFKFFLYRLHHTPCSYNEEPPFHTQGSGKQLLTFLFMYFYLPFPKSQNMHQAIKPIKMLKMWLMVCPSFLLFIYHNRMSSVNVMEFVLQSRNNQNSDISICSKIAATLNSLIFKSIKTVYIHVLQIELLLLHLLSKLIWNTKDSVTFCQIRLKRQVME
jgi:hypothetical protein